MKKLEAKNFITDDEAKSQKQKFYHTPLQLCSIQLYGHTWKANRKPRAKSQKPKNSGCKKLRKSLDGQSGKSKALFYFSFSLLPIFLVS